MAGRKIGELEAGTGQRAAAVDMVALGTIVRPPVRGLRQDAPVRLVLVDGFELIAGEATLWLPRASQRLVAFLALQEHPVLRLYVSGVLWPDTSEKRSAANLRSALWRVQRLGCKVIESNGQHMRLASSVVTDLRELTAVARRLLDRSIDCRDAICSQLYLCGELLRDWYDEWVIMERERFRQLRLHALEHLCEGLTVAGRYGQAVEAGLAAVASEPLRESAQRSLIRAYLAEGNFFEALRQYRWYRKILWDEVKIKPTSDLDRLVSFPG